MISAPTIELCVVAFGSESYAHEWFRSAEAMGASLAVSDNHPAGGSARAADMVARERAAVPYRHIALPSNPGFAAGCNALATSSTSDWLVFLNPDAKLLHWPGPKLLVNRGVIGAKQQSPDGSWIHCSGEAYGIRQEMARSWFRRRQEPAKGRGFVSGGAMAVERETFLALGGFDEAFFLFYEDIDFGLRASASGIGVAVAPNWLVEHDIGHAARRDWNSALQTSYTSGRYFHGKHGSSLRAYDGFIVVDSVVRALYFGLLRRDRDRASAYCHLAWRAVRAGRADSSKR